MDEVIGWTDGVLQAGPDKGIVVNAAVPDADADVPAVIAEFIGTDSQERVEAGERTDQIRCVSLAKSAGNLDEFTLDRCSVDLDGMSGPCPAAVRGQNRGVGLFGSQLDHLETMGNIGDGLLVKAHGCCSFHWIEQVVPGKSPVFRGQFGQSLIGYPQVCPGWWMHISGWFIAE